MACQHRNVLAPFPQAGEVDGEAGDAVVKVFAEVLCLHGLPQVPVGGAYDADVHAPELVSPNPPVFAALQHPQQLGLNCRGQLAHLVQEQGAAVGQLHQSSLVPHAAGEGPALVAEQFVVGQGFVQHRAVDGEERAAGPPGMLMDELGRELLAGAGFTEQQRGHVRPRDQIQLFEHGEKGRRLSH